MNQKPVAIIGGGITGLTTAFRLQQEGIPVRVFESSSRVGGVIRSLRRDGYLAEFGPNSILETSPKIAALVRDLNLEQRRVYSDARAEKRYLVRYKRTIAMSNSPIGFFRTPLFSWKAKLALIREPFIPKAPADIEETLAQFVVRRLCKEFLDYAINPLVAGIYAGDPARLSVRHGFPKLHALEQKYGSLIKGQILGAKERKRRGEVSKQDAKKLSFDEGLEVLPNTMALRLGNQLQLNTEVKEVRETRSGWRLVTASGGDDGTDYAAVLMAVPAHHMPPLKPLSSNAPDASSLNAIRYPPVTSVVLGFKRSEVTHPLDGFGMLIPQAEGFSILGTLFSSSLFPGRAPERHVTVTSYIGGERAPELALLPENEIVARTVQDLQVLLGVSGPPVFQHTVLYPKAIPQYVIGYGKFKEVMTGLEKSAPGLFFAGHYRDGISLGDSIMSGLNAAENIANFWKGRQPAMT